MPAWGCLAVPERRTAGSRRPLPPVASIRGIEGAAGMRVCVFVASVQVLPGATVWSRGARGPDGRRRCTVTAQVPDPGCSVDLRRGARDLLALRDEPRILRGVGSRTRRGRRGFRHRPGPRTPRCDRPGRDRCPRRCSGSGPRRRCSPPPPGRAADDPLEVDRMDDPAGGGEAEVDHDGRRVGRARNVEAVRSSGGAAAKYHEADVVLGTGRRPPFVRRPPGSPPRPAGHGHNGRKPRAGGPSGHRRATSPWAGTDTATVSTEPLSVARSPWRRRRGGGVGHEQEARSPAGRRGLARAIPRGGLCVGRAHQCGRDDQRADRRGSPEPPRRRQRPPPPRQRARASANGAPGSGGPAS